MNILDQIVEAGSKVIIILTYILSILGALKMLARYTPWKFDDKILTFIEKFVKILVGRNDDERDN